MKDPRRSGRYTKARRLWLDGFGGQHGTCCMCGGVVDTSLPGTHPYGPSVEHRVPVRRLLAQASSPAAALAMVCDTSLWALAHRRCNDRQGGASSVERAPKRAPRRNNSREW